jgi:hypothetical protein
MKTLACLIFVAGFTLSAQSQSAPSQTAPAQSPQTQPSYSPLTEEQRFHMYIRGMFGPTAWAIGAVSAGWGQLRDRPEEWGQGARGYGLRYGSGFAQRVTRETLQFGAASILHEDNRYMPSEETGNGARIKYAIESTFLTYKPDGSRRFAFSRIGSILGGSFISRTWQPQSTSGTLRAGQNFGTALGFAVGFNVMREFMPSKWRK